MAWVTGPEGPKGAEDELGVRRAPGLLFFINLMSLQILYKHVSTSWSEKRSTLEQPFTHAGAEKSLYHSGFPISSTFCTICIQVVLNCIDIVMAYIASKKPGICFICGRVRSALASSLLETRETQFATSSLQPASTRSNLKI